jgi:hypothetical protein
MYRDLTRVLGAGGIPDIRVRLNYGGQREGHYVFYFGVDMYKNAQLDFDQLYVDWVTVHVTQH